MPSTTTSSAIEQDSPPGSTMNTSTESAGGAGIGAVPPNAAERYFSNESLEDRNSTTSSAEGSINVERRKVGRRKKTF